MKKFSIVLFAAFLLAAFTLPAMAVEHEFGGYWRTRFYTNIDFRGSDAGDDDAAQDISLVDLRTRLYYTAILSDNLKFVNKIEIDGIWGDGDLGDIGADGDGVIEVKNTYASINAGMLRANIGVTDTTISRGFFFADDFSGAILNFRTDMFQIPLFWIKVDEGLAGKDANEGDADYYGIAPTFNAGPVKLNPMLFYLTTQDAARGDELGSTYIDLNGGDYEAVNAYFLGLDVDATFGPANVWFTGIYEGGTAEGATAAVDDVDISAFLVALGGGANFGMFEAHGEVFFASGDDGEDADQLDAFWVPTGGQSYYWSEIMGFGTFDFQASNGSPNEKISNILAVGIGGSVSPLEKLKIGLDLWYAQLAEEDTFGDKDLGTEVDVTVNYALMEDLNLKVVGAYLFAGDATDPTDGNNDTVNPFELGAQLSLSF